MRRDIPTSSHHRQSTALSWRSLLLPIIVVVFSARPGLGAEDPHPLQPVDTSSPRDTLESFIDACNEVYQFVLAEGRGTDTKAAMAAVNRAVDCFDLSKQPAYLQEYAAKQSLVCLKEVFDRIELPPYEDIPDIDAIKETDTSVALDRWTIPHTEITIAKMEEGPRRGQYLFTATTIDRAAEYYDRVRSLPYRADHHVASQGFYEWFLSEPGSPGLAVIVHSLPDWTRKRVYGQAVWQWFGLVATVSLGLFVMFVAYRLGRARSEVMLGTGVWTYCVTLLFPVAAMLIPILVRYIIEDQLVISGVTLATFKFLMNFVFLLAVLVVLVGAGNRVAAMIISSPRIHPKGIDAQFIRIVCRVASLVAATVVFLEGGKYLGVPLTTLLAGAGVGGLAVALATQDTLKNVFGSMMIIIDKPYRVGERIVVKGYDGIVEEIGLLSTKIRLLTGHQATVPNEQMARSDIENIGRRPHIRRVADIPIPLDTPVEKVHKAVSIIREILQDHVGMKPDYPPRVYQTEFNRDSLNIRFMYWFHPADYWEFLGFGEKVNTRIIEQFAAHGIRFALPATTTFLTQDKERPVHFHVVTDAEGADSKAR